MTNDINFQKTNSAYTHRMSFLSRFKSSSKEKEKSTPSSKSSSTPTSPTILSSPSLLPALTLPSPSFATEASTPSPSLNGGQTWIKVDDEIPSTGSEEEREERVRGEMRRMNGAELSVNQVRELSDLCGKVVRERGVFLLFLKDVGENANVYASRINNIRSLQALSTLLILRSNKTTSDPLLILRNNLRSHRSRFFRSGYKNF